MSSINQDPFRDWIAKTCEGGVLVALIEKSSRMSGANFESEARCGILAPVGRIADKAARETETYSTH